MVTLVTRGRVTHDYLKGFISAPEDREPAVRKQIEKAGGKVLSFYFTTGGFALSPYVPLLGACQGTTRQRWVSDQHRSGTPMIRLRTSIRSRGHLSHLFLRFIGEPRGFDSWAGSGGATRYKKAINLT